MNTLRAPNKTGWYQNRDREGAVLAVWRRFQTGSPDRFLTGAARFVGRS